ncbi:MAG: diacylglycerol kinase family lipid kinase [Sedimentisphaerales bacterium]|nr:diacylglycerol kinase family lipid kinase [Sedimentisphaerales bacterium]
MKPNGGYIQYIINPKSGSSSNKQLVSQFRDYLKERSFRVRIDLTQSLEHARELATRAAEDPECMLVLGAGGDGTIREVVQGMEGRKTPLLVVPSGTENLLGNELGFDVNVKTIIRAFEGDCVRALDLGRANGRCFTSICGFGFDGTVVKIVNEKRKGHINHMDYFWPLWQTFWGHRFPRFEVQADGEEIFSGHGMVFVGNISRYAIGLQLLHYADFGDGLLDLCIYRCRGRIHLLKHSAMTMLKHHANRNDVIYRKCKSIRVSSPSRWVNTEIDGDPGPTLPIEIEVVPQAVQVLVPPNAKPAGIRTRFLRMLS